MWQKKDAVSGVYASRGAVTVSASGSRKSLHRFKGDRQTPHLQCLQGELCSASFTPVPSSAADPAARPCCQHTVSQVLWLLKLSFVSADASAFVLNIRDVGGTSCTWQEAACWASRWSLASPGCSLAHVSLSFQEAMKRCLSVGRPSRKLSEFFLVTAHREVFNATGSVVTASPQSEETLRSDLTLWLPALAVVAGRPLSFCPEANL